MHNVYDNSMHNQSIYLNFNQINENQWLDYREPETGRWGNIKVLKKFADTIDATDGLIIMTIKFELSIIYYIFNLC